MSRRRFPFSLWLLAATAALALCQLVPGIGGVLTAMLAIFWPMVLVNAAMVGVALESVGGAVDRRWLALPALFYLGYAGWALVDASRVGADVAEAARRNAAAGVNFDPARDTLVLSGDQAATRARWLARHRGATVQVAAPGGRTLAIRAVGRRTCDALARDNAGGGTTFESIYQGWLPGPPPIGCFVIQSARAAARATRVTFDDDGTGWNRIAAVTMWVEDEDGRRVSLTGGVANRLAWLPLPYAGCDDHGPGGARRCGAGFLRLRRTAIGTGGPIANAAERLLAEKLGLPERALRDDDGGGLTPAHAPSSAARNP